MRIEFSPKALKWLDKSETISTFDIEDYVENSEGLKFTKQRSSEPFCINLFAEAFDVTIFLSVDGGLVTVDNIKHGNHRDEDD